jgi:molecular chaperone GrpE
MNNVDYNESLEATSNECKYNNASKCHNTVSDGSELVPDILSPEMYSDLSSMSVEKLSIIVQDAQKRIAELETAEQDSLDKHNRLLAEFANYKNRVAREIQFAITIAEKKLLLEFLPVVDNFERCIALVYTNVEDLNSGVTLIYKQLLEALRKVGVEGIEIHVGDTFDAQHSEALTTISRPDLADGVVSTVFERGFMLRDQLLRPARVIVNKQ